MNYNTPVRTHQRHSRKGKVHTVHHHVRNVHGKNVRTVVRGVQPDNRIYRVYQFDRTPNEFGDMVEYHDVSSAKEAEALSKKLGKKWVWAKVPRGGE